MNKTSKFNAILAAVALLFVGVTGGYTWANSKSDNEASSTSSPGSTTLSSVANKASSTTHNEADVMFAQMMVDHHSQALDMAKLAATRASSPDVKTLAAKIEAAQQPEIDMMDGWLKDWGVDSMSGMNHSMPEGMSESDMSMLEKSSGSEFEKMFLAMMIKHHDGAIAMAKDELKSGENADALALASSIYVSQQGQLTQMQALLK